MAELEQEIRKALAVYDEQIDVRTPEAALRYTAGWLAVGAGISTSQATRLLRKELRKRMPK